MPHHSHDIVGDEVAVRHRDVHRLALRNTDRIEFDVSSRTGFAKRLHVDRRGSYPNAKLS